MFFKNIKKALYSIIAFLLLGIGISLQIKAGIGQSMFNAFSMLFADLFHIEIGTMINVFNMLFFIIYLYVKPSPPNRKDLIQIIATMLNGYVINLFTYTVFHYIVLSSYYLKVLTFMLGLFLASVSLGAILAMGMIRFPLESLCLELGQKLNCSLTKIRMRFDVFFLVSTLLFTAVTRHTLYIREGSIVSFFLLSKLMGFSYERLLKLHQNKIP